MGSRENKKRRGKREEKFLTGQNIYTPPILEYGRRQKRIESTAGGCLGLLP